MYKLCFHHLFNSILIKTGFTKKQIMIIILPSLPVEKDTVFMKLGRRSVSGHQMLKGHELDLKVLQF